MSLPWVARACFLAADALRGDRSTGKLRRLRQSQSWSPEALAAWRLTRLNAMLAHAKRHSPFYAQRLRPLTLPLRNWREIEAIPVLTKQDLRTAKAEILCRTVSRGRRIEANTGGSTGTPTPFVCDRVALGWRRAATFRNAEWAGLRAGRPNVQMNGSHYEYTRRQRLGGRLKGWLLQSTDLPVGFLTEALAETYYHEVCRRKPESIWGYASGIYHFAKFIDARHPRTDFSFLRAIITSSETLEPHQRELIQRVFGAGTVFDHYGSSEFYAAAECREHDGYHINADILCLEVVDRHGRHQPSGTAGRILLTDYYNEAFPFIRYEIGDVGVLGEAAPCRCGLTLPKLRRLEGRITDIVTLPDRTVSPPMFNNIFRAFNGVDQYQVVQQGSTEVTVYVVKNGSFTEAFERHIHTSLERVLGPQAAFTVRYVETIAVPESGKRRYVISEMAGSAR